MTTMPLSRTPSDRISVAGCYDDLCEIVAERIAALVLSKPTAVLGLATGSTPLGVYDRLARRHQNGELNFSHVTCFNLDEYYPVASNSPHSYHRFMQENLFGRINCRQWFVPDGRLRSEEEIEQDCQQYEARIVASGGLDLQLLGIGRSGHIGFNEPGSPPSSSTRLVTLHTVTRQDAADSFDGLGNVPSQAVTMGIGTIMKARQLLLMASGIGKADIVKVAWTQDVTEDIPASWVRIHPNAHLCLDRDAASLLPKSPRSYLING